MAAITQKFDVVLVAGSPRRNSNSLNCCRIIAARLFELGLSTRVFDLSETDFRGCCGCLRCNRSAECVLDDEFKNEILPAIRGAAGVVLASPVYFGGVSWLMKAFLDRFRAEIHVEMAKEHITCRPRGRLGRKDAVLVFCQGEPTDDHAVFARQLLRNFVSKVFGGEVVAEVLVRGVAFAGQVVWDERRLEAVLGRFGLGDSVFRFASLNREVHASLQEAAAHLAQAIKKAKPT